MKNNSGQQDTRKIDEDTQTQIKDSTTIGLCLRVNVRKLLQYSAHLGNFVKKCN